MKFSTAVIVAAVASIVQADEAKTVTTTFHGSTDTHKYGRFDKTSPSSSPSSSGTHKYGRFDKTKDPVTTTVFITSPSAVGFAAANASANGTGANGTAGNGSNGSSSASDNGAAASSGAFLGFAGAVAAGLLLI